MPPADPRAEETRRRLIAAGLELFARHGYDAVTTRQLAEAAEVNQAAIPYHFGGKEGVYLAVAEHIAGAAGARVQALAATVRERLGEAADREAVAAQLLETTLAVAHTIFDSGYRGVWALFLTREQFHPSAAFEILYERFAGPVHVLVAELISRLTGKPAAAPRTVLVTHAYLGQILAFAAAHATLDRRLGAAAEAGGADTEAVLAAIEAFSRMAIAGMSNST